MSNVATEFTRYACAKLEQELAQVVRCAGLLSDSEVWHRGNAYANSVGNLLLHLAGNVRQWIVAGLGGVPFERDRPAEFAAQGPRAPRAVVDDLSSVVRAALGVIGGLDAAALATRHTIQGYEVSALVAVFHVVEHFSFHTGQIVHMTKLLRNVDLSLYDAQGHRRSQAETP